MGEWFACSSVHSPCMLRVCRGQSTVSGQIPGAHVPHICEPPCGGWAPLLLISPQLHFIAHIFFYLFTENRVILKTLEVHAYFRYMLILAL